MQLEEESNNKDFLIKRIIINIENERILPAIYNTIAYAKTINEETTINELHQHMNDETFYRKIGFLDIIKSNQETATEYYDDDKDNDPYAYDKETEKKIREIKNLILAFIAKAIKEQEKDALEELLKNINNTNNKEARR